MTMSSTVNSAVALERRDQLLHEAEVERLASEVRRSRHGRLRRWVSTRRDRG